MGIEPFLTSSAIDSVTAQRLARKLCPKCKEAYEPERENLKSLGFPLEEDEDLPVLYKASKCEHCNNTGYKGRIGVYEVMVMSEAVQRLTVEKASTDEIKKVAVEEGMKTLRMEGMMKVKEGATSIEEILRVIV
jgi:type IV pilus assembly protein PilB